MKKIKKSLEAKLTELVLPLNKTFETNLQEKERWLKLERKSKYYRELVLKAEQGIKDALIFLSWEKLSNHHEAQSKLNEFQKETSSYQKVISSLETEIRDLEGKVIIFDKLIRFSCEQEVMHSFHKLATKANDIN